MCSPAPLPVRTLNLYRGYRCRHAGVCCSAGWDIGIDGGRLGHVTDALARGTVVLPSGCLPGGAFQQGAGLPDGAAAVLARRPDGACAFFDAADGRLCAIHRGLGHEALPSACRHFPRVLLFDDRGTHVAFSHVCPTATGLLFREDLDCLRVEENAGALAATAGAEGFDARGTVPPFVRPGIASDAGSAEAWELFVLASCDRADESPEQVLARLADGAERLRGWVPARGSMAQFAHGALGDVLGRPAAPITFDGEGAARLQQAVWRATPDALRGVAPGGPAVSGAHVEPWGGAWWRVVNRYLAARAFGAWSAYLGEGLRTQVALLAAALAVLRAEAERHAAEGRTGEEGLRAALASTDMRMVHRCDERTLCRTQGRVESVATDRVLGVLGLCRP